MSISDLKRRLDRLERAINKRESRIPPDAVCAYCNRRSLKQKSGVVWCSYCGTLATFRKKIEGENWYQGYVWYFPESFDLDDVSDPEVPTT
jgi:hypothetical protein